MNDDKTEEYESVGDTEDTIQLPLISGNSTTDDQYPYMNDTTEDDDEWPSHIASKGIRIPLPVTILLVVLAGFGGIWGGAALQRSQKVTSANTLASAFSHFRSGASGGAGAGAKGGFSGFGGFGGSATAGSAATGTLTVVDGNTLYITDASGGIVKVIVNNSTKVTRNAVATSAALQPGDTVTIQGNKSQNGTINATSISATAGNVATGLSTAG